MRLPPPMRPLARHGRTRSTPGARALARVALAALASGALAGCARPAGPIFSPGDPTYQWPPPPDTPRIRYIGQLQTDADLKPGRGPGKGLGEFLFGKEPARSMLSPLGLCTDGKDRLFVADSNAQVVHVFDLAARRYEQWRPPENEARFSQPTAAAYDPRGRLLVSDSVGGVVFAFDPAGRYLGALGYGALKRPCGLAVAPDGRLFVADAAAHRIVVLADDGRESARIGGRGEALGQFNFPTNVAFDSRGNLYVSDSLNFRVQVLEPRGSGFSPVRQIGRKGDLPGYFSQPKGLTLDREDHLYVVDANFEAVQVFDPAGALLMSFGREGRAPGEFWLPAGIHADPSGRIWVADSYNRRVQVFQYLPEGATP